MNIPFLPTGPWNSNFALVLAGFVLIYYADRKNIWIPGFGLDWRKWRQNYRLSVIVRVTLFTLGIICIGLAIRDL